MNLVPWKRKKEVEVLKSHDDPAFGLTRGMTDLVNDLFRTFDDEMGGFLAPYGRAGFAQFPSVDVSETGEEVTVSADLPGLTEKDLHVELDGNCLTLKGERRHEREEKKRNYRRVERSYGSFQRTVILPEGIDRDKVDASFRNGELVVKIAKLPDAQSSRRRIDVKAA